MSNFSSPLLLLSSQGPSRVSGQWCPSSGNDLWPSIPLLLLYFTVEGEGDPGSRFLNQGTAGDCLTMLLHLIYRSASSVPDPYTPCQQIWGHQRYATTVLTIRFDRAVYSGYSEEVCEEFRERIEGDNINWPSDLGTSWSFATMLMPTFLFFYSSASQAGPQESLVA